MLRKIGLYILSLWLLLVIVIILTIDIPIYFGPDWYFIGMKELLMRNIIPCICICIFIIGLIIFYSFKFQVRGTPKDKMYQIVEVRNIEQEHLSFISLYIIPFLSINIGEFRGFLITVILLTVMGIIYIRSGIFYRNPTLSILGFKIYEASVIRNNSGFQNIILISQRTLFKDEIIEFISLEEDNQIYYVQKIIKQ